MLRGFYTAASGMIAQQRNQETISNNIANANTPGYKADQATIRSFPELLIQQMDKKNIPTTKELNVPVNSRVGGLSTGVYVQETIPDFSQGPVRETGLSTDVAIVNGNLPDETGGIFFTLQNETGDTRYTRNGHFTVDGEGFLTANNGYYVLDVDGNRIQTNNTQFEVTPQGDVQVAEGENIRLRIAYVADTTALVKEENDLLALDEGEAIGSDEAGAAYEISQGALEGSNVDALQGMTDMMSAYRNFEQNQRVLKTYDESMAKAVNDIARLG